MSAFWNILKHGPDEALEPRSLHMIVSEYCRL